MADDCSDTSSLSSLSRNGFPLFPSLRENPPSISSGGSQKEFQDSQHSQHSQESTSSFSDLGSRSLFRGWDKNNSNGSKTNFFSASRSQKGKTNESSESLTNPAGNGSSKQVESTKRNDSEGVDLSELRPSSSSSVDTHTLNTSVVRAVCSKLTTGDIDDSAVQRSKFKYVKMYEDALKTLEPQRSASESVFGVSGLDEFNQFVALSELDQKIQEKVASHQRSKDFNVLSVLDEKDFHKLYNHQDMDAQKETSKKRLKFTFPWKKSPGHRAKVEDSVSKNTSENGNHSESESENQNNQARSDDSRYSDDSRTSTFRDYALLHRKLEVRHLQMISMGGTLGVGLYLNVGKSFTIAGGLGTVLAMFLVGLIVLATVISFCEMVTFVSVIDGVSGLGSRFVDESFGFATGWLYFLSFSFGLAGEIVASVIILSYFPSTEILTNPGATAGFVALFLFVCILSNVSSVTVFGEIEYITSLMKVIITLLGIVVMIVVNRGGIGAKGAIGFKYWQYSKSDFEHNLIFGPFRPSFNLLSDGTDSEHDGIGGNLGRFLSLIVSLVVAAYAYSGTEIVCIAACEAKDPRKALPSATNRVFWRILLFYCLSSFVVSLNIYAGDPRLLRFFSGTTGVSANQFDSNYAINHIGGAQCNNSTRLINGLGNGSQSPWIVAFQSAGSCGWSGVVNALLFFFALSCGNSHLYVSSRTLYSLALQHKAPGFLKKCNRYGTPYYAVLVAVIPGLLSFTTMSQKATVVFQNLTSLVSSSGVFVWFSMCLTYIRFYYGLKRRPDIMSRDDKSYPYRSAFQPYSAFFGLFGTSVILLSMGYVVFLKGSWNTWFFFSSYGTLIFFVVLYVGHWIIKGTTICSLEALDFDSGRREKDIYIWDGGKEYNLRKVKDLTHKIVDWLA
ncbi:hypothetical protein JCM33374_g3203 [Metschnikowia sp. JCM 33374]|nr:hypothetical protein JCM33374_g3203 [Metschnikowia sp. JCM 33374]